MYINELPFEILSKILEEAARANIRDRSRFTFGLSQPPMPYQKATLQRYVKGPVPPDMLRWDATSAMRLMCWRWHEWALEYALNDVYIRRWKGGERWAELSLHRENYGLYELIDRPTSTAVYRDPFAALKHTIKTFNSFPAVAAKIKRMWFHGFYTADANYMVFKSLRNCINLTSVSLPWTALRHLDAHAWQSLLVGNGKPLQSLELLAVNPTSRQASDNANRLDLQPLQSVNLSMLRRLKFFGDTNFMPITDDDLFAIARTATHLQEFYLTCMSTVTINGVMVIVRASRSTLRVLEHSPRSQDGFWHPHPGSPSDSEHLCEFFRDCPKLETLSISLPSMCADLFSNSNAKFTGDLQVRALHLCGHEHGSTTHEATEALQKLLHQARALIDSKASSVVPRDLYIELFFADCIFEPSLKLVHGDFSPTQVAEEESWMDTLRPSGKGPYGSTGLYEKEKDGPFQSMVEDDFLRGVRDCQKADWKTHKKECSKYAAETFRTSTEHSSTYSAPRMKDLEAHVPNPFTRLDRGNYLYDRPQTDVYNLLVDSFRMRQADDFDYEGKAMPRTVYTGASTSTEPFREYLEKAAARPKLLPPWWTSGKQEECAIFGQSGAWSNLGKKVTKQEVIEHYGDEKMPMQLRMLAEMVYGTGTMGQDGSEVRKLMVQMESGGSENGQYMSMFDASRLRT